MNELSRKRARHPSKVFPRFGPPQFEESPTGIQDLIPPYLKRRAGDVELLRKSIGSLDFDEIARLGHKMSGNGSLFGFDEISLYGRTLEAAALDQNMTLVCEQIEILDRFLGTLQPKEAGST